MTRLKRMIIVGTIVLTVCSTGMTVFATSQYKTPAEAVAGITGRTVESVINEKVETGKTYGEIAKAAGKFEEFKAENLQIQKDNINAQVANGILTQEKADSIIKAIEENQAICNNPSSNHGYQGLKNYSYQSLQ